MILIRVDRRVCRSVALAKGFARIFEFATYCAMRYNEHMVNKQAISFRLTPEAIALIKELAKKLGVSQADIIEMAVRKFAKQENAQ